MSEHEKIGYFIYGAGFIVSLVVWSWFMRKELTEDRTDPDVVMPVLMGSLFWPLVLFGGGIVGVFWLIANGCGLLAARMIALEQSKARRQERRELREKAQREIFADVDRMLQESNDDEIRAFMSKLKPATLA